MEKTAGDPTFGQLKEAVEAGDLAHGFELAHALKGVTANLSLTPLETPVIEITELLRSRTETDYGPLLDQIAKEKQKLTDMI